MQKNTQGYFSYLPISLFGSVMGLSAMSISWYFLQNFFSSSFLAYILSKIIMLSFSFLALMSFIALIIAYALKVFSNFKSVQEEFLNPLTRPFFGTFAIACLLIPMVLSILLLFFKTHFFLSETFINHFEIFNFGLWILGAVMMLAFSIHVLSFWICHKHELSQITPAWIIPVVGLLDIPLASAFLKQNILSQDIFLSISLACLAIGFFFTIVLSPLILARIIFFEKLPEKLMPSLFILLAPFGVGFNTYYIAFGIDYFSLMLLAIGFFLFLALLPQLFKAYRCCPFRITWWAISFPLAALNIALVKTLIDFNLKSNLYTFFVISFVIFSTLIFLCLIIRTLEGIFIGELKNLT